MFAYFSDSKAEKKFFFRIIKTKRKIFSKLILKI